MSCCLWSVVSSDFEVAQLFPVYFCTNVVSIMDLQTCVICKTVKQHARALRCLHPICTDCILVKTSAQGTILCLECGKVTPAPGNGKNHLLTLPVYTSPAKSADSRAAKKMCVECMEDKEATSSCVQCKATLCEGHASVHPLSKVSWKHSVVALDDTVSTTSSSDVQQVHGCALHLSSPLISYCCSCNEILCAICQSHSPHTSHTDEILSIADAARKKREELAQEMNANKSADCPGSIEAGLTSVKEVITALNDRTEQVSSDIKESFDKVRKEIDKREKQLLGELDKLRWHKLEVLDDQRLRLSQKQNSRNDVEMMFENCHDDVNLLRLSPWLQESLVEHTSAAEKDSMVCVSSYVVSEGFHLEPVVSKIQTLGAVRDVADSLSHCHLSCVQEAVKNSEVALELRLGDGDDDGCSVSLEDLAGVGMQLEAVCPDGSKCVCKLEASCESGVFAAKYTPVSCGQHVISATVKKLSTTCSPITIDVVESAKSLAFDRNRCHSSLTLSKNDSVATVSTSGIWCSVCGVGRYSSGQVEFHVKICAGRYPFICVCNADAPVMTSGFNQPGKVFGWSYTDGNKSCCQGGCLGRRWQSGDIISLFLDCDRHTLEGVHQRTGTKETLTLPAGSFYLLVSLCDRNGQVELIPSP